MTIILEVFLDKIWAISPEWAKGQTMRFISDYDPLDRFVSLISRLSKFIDVMQEVLQQTLNFFPPVVWVLTIRVCLVGVKAKFYWLIWIQNNQRQGSADDISLWISQCSPSVVPCWCWKVEEIKLKPVNVLWLELNLTLVPFWPLTRAKISRRRHFCPLQMHWMGVISLWIYGCESLVIMSRGLKPTEVTINHQPIIPTFFPLMLSLC